MDELTAAIQPKVWSQPNDSGLCVLVAGTPGWDTPVDILQVDEASKFIYDNLVKLQFSELHPVQFEDLIRKRLTECERKFSFEYFVSVGVVIRERRAVFVATVGNIETWYLRDMGLLQLTSQTSVELPVPTRNKVFLSCLAGNLSKGSFPTHFVPPSKINCFTRSRLQTVRTSSHESTFAQ